MNTTLTLEGYTPPERFPPDDALWTQARIEEAPLSDPASWTVIEPAFALDPPVVDPAEPPTYSFTTTGQQFEQGYYRVVWIDAGAVEQATQPVELRALSIYAPTVGEVAAILRARIVSEGGERPVNFTDETEPTAAEVATLISMHAPMIFARTGSLADLACANADEVRQAVKTLIAQRVAHVVELSYRPEEVVEGWNAAALWRELSDSDVAAVVAAVDRCRIGDTSPDTPGDQSSLGASYAFPPPVLHRW